MDNLDTNTVIIASISLLIIVYLIYTFTNSGDQEEEPYVMKLTSPSPSVKTWTPEQRKDIELLWMKYMETVGINCINTSGQADLTTLNYITSQIIDVFISSYDYNMIKNAILSQWQNPGIDMFGYLSPEVKMKIKYIFQDSSKGKCQMILPYLFYTEPLFT